MRRVKGCPDRAVRNSVFCIFRAMLSIRLDSIAVRRRRALGPSARQGLMTFIILSSFEA